MTAPRRSTRGLIGLLSSAGAAHFAAPKLFDPMVPRSLPGSSRFWTYASGAAELALAAALVHPRTRRNGSLATAAFFTAVLPANIKMAHDWRDRPAPLRAGAYARLPLQAPLIWWAFRARHDNGG